jgi:polar amino acid transport system substrate-binding protein
MQHSGNAMKQVVQHLKNGDVRVEEVPAPALRGPGVLVATACSLISPGTERASVELGRASLLGKALRRPDQVRRVLDNLRREGLRQTVQKVQQRLDTSRAMGYSCSGVVLEALDCELAPGTRVACTGTDAATHAEINFVPRNLCAAIPEGVGFDEAAFVALGGIALHAVHLSGAGLGEDVAVIGLGPVGLLLAQALRAAGCRVAGFDLREDRLRVAQSLGLERTAQSDRLRLMEQLRAWNLPRGFDAVFIAAASSSSEPLEWAVEAAADRARIVVVGDVHTDISRSAAYAKELTVLYARSYGPGRYEPQYEERGVDYPPAHVRWTLGRNLASFLDLLARKQIAVAPLITHRLPIEQAARAYEIVSGAEPSLGVLLEYTVAESRPATTIEVRPRPARREGVLRVGCIGAGSYAASTLLPLLKADPKTQLLTVVTARGVSAKKAAEQFGFARCSTDPGAVLHDPDVDCAVIATRHDSHALLAIGAIEAGKAVFVEKPLCLREEELEAIEVAWRANPVPLMVGFNRRFAPATAQLREFFSGRSAPLSMQYTVHAGPLPESHWLRDPAQGGRIAGEVCHFVDWCSFITESPCDSVFASVQGATAEENLHAVLRFADGSQAAILYDTSAHNSLPKETIEVSCAGRTARIENFTDAFFFDARGRHERFRGKGQDEMLRAFLDALRAGKELPHAKFASLAASTRATLKLLESASTRLPVWLHSSD